jgi:hypothetical protein
MKSYRWVATIAVLLALFACVGCISAPTAPRPEQSSRQRLQHLPEAMPLVPEGAPNAAKERQARPMPLAPAEQQG